MWSRGNAGVATLILCSFFIQHGDAARKLPSGIVACKRSDPDLNACALKSANNAVSLFSKGIPSLSLPPMDPLKIEQIHIGDSGTSRQFTIDLVLNDLDVSGMRDMVFSDVQVDPESGKMVITGTAPLMSLIGSYNVKARLLLLPIVSTGSVNITLQNVTFTYSLKLVRNGKFASPTENDVNFTTTKPNIKLDRFINGNKAISDTVSAFFNENWQDVVADLGPPIAEALNVASTRAVTAVFSQVPYDDIFPQ